MDLHAHPGLPPGRHRQQRHHPRRRDHRRRGARRCGPEHGSAKSGPLLAHVRQVDAICEVVRCFDGTDARSDITRLEEELVLADQAVVEPALDKARRTARSGDADAKARVAVLEKSLAVLEEGRPIRTVTDFAAAEAAIVRSFGLITGKRILYVANVAAALTQLHRYSSL